MKVCKVEGCLRIDKFCKGYCGKHYSQMYKYGKIFKRTKNDPNEIIIKGDIAEIILYSRENKEIARAIIDAEDVEKVKEYKWHVCKKSYVSAHIETNGQKYLSVVIMGFDSKKDSTIDHKDRNPLNNQKYNLRLCTQAQNCQNKGNRRDNKSGHKGVFWDKERKKWRAEVQAAGKKVFNKRFESKTQAIIAYNNVASKYHSEFACFNPL